MEVVTHEATTQLLNSRRLEQPGNVAFSKIYEKLQNSRRQKDDVKYVKYLEPTNIRHYHNKL